MAEEKFVAEEVLLELARPELYRSNAFRITELPVDATARDISRRQVTIKQATSMGMPVDPGYGRALPLKEQPDPDMLSEAIQHLGDPEQRLVEELFWFWPRHFGESRSDEALTLLKNEEINTIYQRWRLQNPADDSSAQHNLAVLSHASALDWEYKAFSSELSVHEQAQRDFWWQEAFRNWRIILENEAFWSQVTKRIRDLDDPRLTTGLAQRLRTTLPQVLLLINAQLAVRAAEHKSVPECRRQIALMRGSGFDQQVIDEALQHAVEPVRERIKIQCKRIETQWQADPKQADDLTKRFLDQSQPMLEELDTLLPAGNAVRDSMHDEVAQLARTSIVNYGNETKNWQTALPVIDRILRLAVSPALQARIKEDRTTYRNNLSPALCWYCGKNPPWTSCAYEVKMYGNVTRTPIWQNGRMGTRVQWQNVTVQVPRCTSCKSAHNRVKRSWGIGCGTGIAIFIAAFIAIVVMGSPNNVTLMNQLSLASLLFLVVEIVATFVIVRKYVVGALRKEGIRELATSKDFPDVQLRKAQGWQVGERPPM